jgi:exonuclease III
MHLSPEWQSADRNSIIRSLGLTVSSAMRELSRNRVPPSRSSATITLCPPISIYPTESWDDDALLQPESRAAYQRLLKQGWTDSLRYLYPDEPMYTFWDYMRHRWENDKGLRLDHFLLSPDLKKRLVDGGVDRKVRGKEGASDHAPAWIELK